MEELAGVTAIDNSTAGVTVKRVEPNTEPEAAWIAVAPGVQLALNPAPLIVATIVFEELQLAELVRSCVLPST